MDQGFSAMTSHTRRSQNTTPEVCARTSSPIPRAKAYSSNQSVVDTRSASMAHVLSPPLRNFALLASNNPYPHEAPDILNEPPRYPESTQRTAHQNHEQTSNSYAFQSSTPAYLDGLPNDFNTNAVSTPRQGVHHRSTYSPIADLSADRPYHPDFNTSFSSNIHSPQPPYHLPPLPSISENEAPGILDYRSSLRAYHDLQSNGDPYRQQSFQQSLRLSRNSRSHAPQNHELDSNSQSLSMIANNCRPTSPEDPSANSPSLTHHRQRHQHLSPLIYDSSTVAQSSDYRSNSGSSHHNNLAHSTEHRLTTTTYGAGPLDRSSHASSSIPMSNSHAHSDNNNNNNNNSNNSNAHANCGVIKSAQSQVRDESASYNETYHSRNSIEIYSTPLVPSSLDSSFARYDRQQQQRASDPRSRSMPEDLIHAPFPSLPSLPSISSYQSGNTSDNDSAVESDMVVHENDDHFGHTSLATHGEKRKTASASQSMPEGKRRMPNVDDVRAISGDGEGGDAAGGGPSKKKKKKKSKMHGCEVCGKKFPRPSGLKTHMNMHSNEKPFPCGFPGCPRTFGVRSNAKRHLRTHGVQLSGNTATDVQPLYVVGFEPPVILPAQPTQGSESGGSSSSSNTSLTSAGLRGSSTDRQPGDRTESGERVGEPVHVRDTDRTAEQQKSPREFKLRWMPPSLSSRTNVREGGEGEKPEECASGSSWPPAPTRPWIGAGVKKEQQQEDDGDAHEEQISGLRLWTQRDESDAEDVENMALDQEQGMYSDMAAAARLILPLRPVYHSSTSGGDPVDGNNDDRSIPPRSFMPDENDSSTCQCNPKCTHNLSGSSRCPSSSSSSSSFGLSSLSPSSQAESFIAQSSMTSISTSPLLSSIPQRYKSNISDFDVVPTSPDEFVEERNSYMDIGSYPYHPSQFRGLPGPSPTNAAVPSRSYMMV